MFLITGFPRSGTKYLAAVLQAAGLDVGHEAHGTHGVVSWCHVADGYLSWAGDIFPQEFSHTIQVVRDPLKVISSAQTLKDETFEFMFKHIGRPSGPRSIAWYMFAWLKWNELIEKKASFWFRLEDFKGNYNSILSEVGVVLPDLPELPENINSRLHSNYSWTDLKRADKKLYKQVRDKAIEYGYTIEAERLPKISVIMMMKNEADMLPSCLESVQAVADEICIVDTGSTDDSINIANAYGAKIIESPWRDDFSFHRNESAGMASGDWLFQIDCDEELILPDPDHLKRFLQSLPDSINGVAVEMRDIKSGNEPMIFNSPRIFRAGKVNYKGIVHNVPEYGNIATPFYPGGHLNHYGYDLPPEKMEVKHKRTITLLKKRIMADSNDADALFLLAQSYSAMGENSKAMEYAVKHLAFKGSEGFNDSVYFAMISLAMSEGEFDFAGRLLDEAETALPHDVDIAQARVEYAVKKKDVGMIMSGCMRFIQNYDYNKQNPAAKGNRFIYCQTPEKNIFNTFQAMFLLLYDVVRLKDRLESELANVDDAFREKTMADMDREFKRFAVTIGGN